MIKDTHNGCGDQNGEHDINSKRPLQRSILSFYRRQVSVLFLVLGVTALVFAQPRDRGPRMRKHTVTRAGSVRLVPATKRPQAKNRHSVRIIKGERVLGSNGIPAHLVGAFPNSGNPHTITEQNYDFKIPADPEPAHRVSPVHYDQGTSGPPNRPLGIALNGVLFDPGTAEFWNGDRDANWNYEALGGSIDLGLDDNHAHVQPTGAYHYHGLPTKYLAELGVSRNRHSPQVGWAADGFPIYALYGYKDPRDPSSQVVEMTSSYRLRSGKRPSGKAGPGGKYDGAFLRDYEFANGRGTLDECNGRFCVTPEFPNGTYAYFLTNKWPVVPRNFRGTPAELRSETRGQQGKRRDGRRPPRRGR